MVDTMIILLEEVEVVIWGVPVLRVKRVRCVCVFVCLSVHARALLGVGSESADGD